MVADSKIQKLNDYRHTRLRTEILFGSRVSESRSVPIFDGEKLEVRTVVFTPSIFTCFREILDNSLDEVVKHGHGDTITVDFDAENFVFTVEDNGRGIPIHHDEELGGIVASVALSSARTGRNFEERGDVAGMNGVGASGVNFTSEFFELDVWRGSKHLHQEWREGPDETHLTDGPVIKTIRGKKNGTRVRFTPSRKIYQDIILHDMVVRSHLWMIACLYPNLKLVFNGVHLRPKGGMDCIAKTLLAGYKPFVLDAKGVDFTSTFWVVPNFTPEAEVAYGLVNLIPSWTGMDHVDGFRTLFYTSVMDALESRAKKERLTLLRADVAWGVLVYNVTSVTNATFDSQSKSRLTKANVNSAIKTTFDADKVKALLKANPEWVEQILSRARERQTAKDQKDIDKAQKASKKTKVVGLLPATGIDRQRCILFLTEGESAVSQISDARTPEIHGALGLRGKVRNTHASKTKPKDVIGDTVLVGIMQSLGLELGKLAARRELRYGAVYLATDEDEDGKNITALLVNFFHRFWPELFDPNQKPFIYRFETPYIIARKGKTVRYFYAHNYAEFQDNLEKYKGWDITRAKGLAALTDVDWEHALTNPCVVPLVDDGSLEQTLDLIFNETRAGDRRDWLASGD